MKSIILEGGITGWAKAGDEYVKLMYGYQGDVWK
jgi:arsenical-resistance protein 2